MLVEANTPAGQLNTAVPRGASAFKAMEERAATKSSMESLQPLLGNLAFRWLIQIILFVLAYVYEHCLACGANLVKKSLGVTQGEGSDLESPASKKCHRNPKPNPWALTYSRILWPMIPYFTDLFWLRTVGRTDLAFHWRFASLSLLYIYGIVMIWLSSFEAVTWPFPWHDDHIAGSALHKQCQSLHHNLGWARGANILKFVPCSSTSTKPSADRHYWRCPFRR